MLLAYKMASSRVRDENILSFLNVLHFHCDEIFFMRPLNPTEATHWVKRFGYVITC